MVIRPYRGGIITLLDTNDGGSLSPDAVTDGHQDYLFEVPDGHSIMSVPVDKKDLIIKSVKPPEHNDKCATKTHAAIIHAHIHAHPITHAHTHIHIHRTLKHLGCVC
jgi:hypothetical protein